MRPENDQRRPSPGLRQVETFAVQRAAIKMMSLRAGRRLRRQRRENFLIWHIAVLSDCLRLDGLLEGFL